MCAAIVRIGSAPSDAAWPLAASAAATGTSRASASLRCRVASAISTVDNRELPHEDRVTPWGAEERVAQRDLRRLACECQHSRQEQRRQRDEREAPDADAHRQGQTAREEGSDADQQRERDQVEQVRDALGDARSGRRRIRGPGSRSRGPRAEHDGAASGVEIVLRDSRIGDAIGPGRELWQRDAQLVRPEALADLRSGPRHSSPVEDLHAGERERDRLREAQGDDARSAGETGAAARRARHQEGMRIGTRRHDQCE